MYLKILTTLFIGILMSGCTTKELSYDSKYFKDGVFKNPDKNFDTTFSEQMSLFWYFFTDDTKNKSPKEGEVPVNMLSREDILNMANDSVVRIGHSTLLFKLDNRYILIDPVFGQRTSPVSFMGPKRFHKPPMQIEDLPFIDILVISHNHYDHLDEYSLERLKDKVGIVYTTLGISQKLIEVGIDSSKIIELDWWQGEENESISITATPAQHFSGRGMFDKNKTFWASWVIKSSNSNIYFSGDSGYSTHFKEIAEKFGPFDMSFMETGAYNERWKEIHMMPSESVQAHIDLNAKIMFPIHNGTFKLSTHPWREPFDLAVIEAEKKDVKITHPIMGEIIPLKKYKETKMWW